MIRKQYSFILVCSFLLLLSGCGKSAVQKTAQPERVNVTVAKPLLLPIVEWDEYTGRLEAIDSVEVRARVSGYLESTHFLEGQVVERGDLLAIIDPRPFEVELVSAKARLTEAIAKLGEVEAIYRQTVAESNEARSQLGIMERRLERTRELFERNAVAREELDLRQSEAVKVNAEVKTTEAALDSAKAAVQTSSAMVETSKALVEAAELNIRYTQIRAPISGRISRRNVTEGNLISGGTSQSTLITTIVSLNPIHCYFDANEQAFLKYVRLAREGKRRSSREYKNPVYVALVDETGFPHAGHMDFVDNQIDPNTSTMRGRAILPNQDGLLTPGLFATVRIPGSGRYEAILIPDSAIGSDQSEKYVYIVSNSGVIERRAIETGPLSHGLRIVRKGLDGTETLVTRGLQRVYPGIEVNAELETIESDGTSDLPDDYSPVPEEQWLSRQPPAAPEGIPANSDPFSDSDKTGLDQEGGDQ